ncbi:MAG: response regulator transcription factor [Crocinitomicaceae bacterium]|nr:response regulator transcription factor [Crocinitomicaceae bacterium]
MEAKTIQLAITDDELLFRKGMKLLLNGYEGINVSMESENGLDLINQLKNATELPDILLLDLKMPEMNGIEVAKVIRQDFPEVKIIVLSTHFSRAFVINMIELSAVAYLPKNSQPATVVETIRAVHSKGFHYGDEVMEIIRENLISKKKEKIEFSTQLSKRETEVLQLICEQYSAPEIAEKLFISPRTVDGHRNNLLLKLDCKNVAGLVVLALQKELVDIPLKY